MSEVDLFEISEAFSVQLIAVLRQLGIDSAKVNVNGGAVAWASDRRERRAKILTTLLGWKRKAESRNRGALSRRRQRRRGSRRASAVVSGFSRTGMDADVVSASAGPDNRVADPARIGLGGTGGFCDCPHFRLARFLRISSIFA